MTVSGTTGFQMGYVGSRGLVQSLINNPHTRENISSFLNRKDTFSLCCGELGFEFLSAFKALEHPSTGGDDDLTDVSFQSRHFDLEETASQLHESLWLSFYVPINTRSLMLSPLRGTTFPCWINGTHLGVRFLSDGLEYSMETRGMVSLFFQGPRTGSGHHARHYPRNPSGNSPVAGLCSLNGRHLALLCDPSLAFYPWQWQHIPRKLQGLKTSPWAVMFHSMFLHCVKNSGWEMRGEEPHPQRAISKKKRKLSGPLCSDGHYLLLNICGSSHHLFFTLYVEIVYLSPGTVLRYENVCKF